jgi:hypothetical protein
VNKKKGDVQHAAFIHVMWDYVRLFVGLARSPDFLHSCTEFGFGGSAHLRARLAARFAGAGALCGPTATLSGSNAGAAFLCHYTMAFAAARRTPSPNLAAEQSLQLRFERFNLLF